MQLDQYVHTLGFDLKRRFKQRVRKLTIDGDFTCPNRDGSLGRGGCTFCNVDSFVKPQQQLMSVASQLAQRRQEMKHKDIKYLAYFQAYTSTYAEIAHLQRMYQQALAADNVIGICVGTRPDCLPEQVLQMLAEYQQRGKEVWLELGLQSAKDTTLKKINRGHDFAAYQQAVELAQKYQLKVCCHLILGLPGERHIDYRQTLDKVLAVGVEGIKLHPLHIVTGSSMEKAYKAGKLETISREDYVNSAVDLIQNTPPSVVYHRVSAHANKPLLVAPEWCVNRWHGMVDIARQLAQSGSQGSALGQPFSPEELLTVATDNHVILL